MPEIEPRPGEVYRHINGWNMRVYRRTPKMVAVRHSPGVRGGRDIVDWMRLSTFKRIAERIAPVQKT